LARKMHVTGYDTSLKRVEELKKGYDHNNEFSKTDLESLDIELTNEEKKLSKADFFIITVPTPIDAIKQPDFSYLISASHLVGKYLKSKDVVVYESTVYPGATEEVCIPALEDVTSLKAGIDFTVGYSPERINPGDKEHVLSNTVKIISAQDEETLDILAKIYGSITEAGVYRAPSIKVAEAAKVVENTQRDLNISLMNELSFIFHRLNIDTLEVLKAAETKWNFLPFRSGLVGGHCIGVDPYYLIHKAQQVGYYPNVILAARQINDLMGRYVAEHTVKNLIHIGVSIKHCRVAVFGLTFKENSADIRNSRIVDLIEELCSYGVEVLIHDPIAVPELVKEELNLELNSFDEIVNVEAIILAVAHDDYRKLDSEFLKRKLDYRGLIMDIKGILDPNAFKNSGIMYWRL
jgi:UDP-N-acetyl-D-glucosamine/UDP-N-acetyl-D-galactosamine dehydrogenase